MQSGSKIAVTHAERDVGEVSYSRRTVSWWRSNRISADFHDSSLPDKRSHANKRVTIRSTNRKHMTEDQLRPSSTSFHRHSLARMAFSAPTALPVLLGAVVLGMVWLELFIDLGAGG